MGYCIWIKTGRRFYETECGYAQVVLDDAPKGVCRCGKKIEVDIPTPITKKSVERVINPNQPCPRCSKTPLQFRWDYSLGYARPETYCVYCGWSPLGVWGEAAQAKHLEWLAAQRKCKVLGCGEHIQADTRNKTGLCEACSKRKVGWERTKQNSPPPFLPLKNDDYYLYRRNPSYKGNSHTANRKKSDHEI